MSNRQAPSGTFSPVLQNDLEPPVLTRHPLLAEIKQQLLANGARGVLMSGSGSTIFALFDSEAIRSVAQHNLQTNNGLANGWWCAPARTLNRREYRQALQLT